MPRPNPLPQSVATLPRLPSNWLPTADQPDLPLSDPGRPGLDFATQDYLGLAPHPALRSAAMAALGRFRLIGSLSPDGRAAPAPLPPPVEALQARLAGFLHLAEALTFPTGTEALATTLATLLCPGDHAIVDAGCPPAVLSAVHAAKAHPHRTPPGLVEGVERRLRRLGAARRTGQVYVIVPAVAAFTSVTADLGDLVGLCATFGARLVVDVSHDLGAMAQGGRGVIELQGCLGLVDIVTGSLAKSFGATAGFAGFRDPALAARVRRAHHPGALSPVLAAALLAAFDLIDSPDGRRRRRRLHGNGLRLRNHLMADGLRVLGQPSPLVPVPLPPASALERSALLRSAGPEVPLMTAPLVPGRAPRWRILLSSNHSPADIDDLAELIRDVTRAIDRQDRRTRAPARAAP